MYKYLLSLWICLLCCSGCQEEIGNDAVNGSLSIQLTDEIAPTRTLPSVLSDELQQQFQIELLRDKDGKDVQEYSGLLKDFGNNRSLRVGTYKLCASYGENKLLALDEPYYYGEVQDVLIEANRAHSVTVSCSVANSLATFILVNKEVFDKRMKEYYVEVTVEGTSVTWKPDDTTHPYFKAGSRVEFTLKGISRETGQEYSYSLNPIENVEPGVKYNYNLTLKTSASVGGIFDIVTEAQPESITINETVPETWLPKPKIASNDFDASGLLMYTETADAVPAEISYSAVRPVQEVEFELSFVDANLASLNKTYQLSSLSVEERTTLENAGIQLPAWDGTSINGKIDFTALTPKLLTQNGGQEVNNQIKLKVAANDRWSDEATYTIKTVKPVFKVSVYPGNIWTKEFTINALTEENTTTGNLNKFANLQYEFSTDQNQWSAFNADLRKEALVPGTNYYVRAKYRGEVSSEVTEVRTYENLAIPNCGLNDGYDTTNPKKDNPLYTFQGGWIGTRNPLTCHASGANAFYVSKSSTLPISDNGSTVAHMMTIGWGLGNTCSVGNKSGSVINNISAGVVCVGDYIADGDVIRAKPAYIRPTSMTFTFKASPYNGDEYLVEAYLVNRTDDKETVIGEASLKSDVSYSSYQTHTLSFSYAEEVKYLAISHVKIIFKAGTKEDRDHLEDNFRDASLWNGYTNAYIIGSQFWLDSFSLTYDK